MKQPQTRFREKTGFVLSCYNYRVDNLRVLVVADDPLARAGLATLIAGQPSYTVTGQIAGDSDLSQALEVYRPDVIVWDAGTRAELSLERLANARDLRVPIVALLADGAAAPDAWSSGARGLLSREADADHLTAALSAVASGLSVFDPVFATTLLPARTPSPTPLTEELTPRELQVLRLLAEGDSNKEIARRLGISDHTVKFHVNAILGKLNVQSRTEAVVRATRLGLILL